MSIKTCLSTHLKSTSLLAKFDKLVEGGMDENLAAREVILDGHKAIHDRANTLKSILKLPTENYVRPTIDQAKIEAINKSAEEKVSAIKAESAVKKEAVEKKVAEVKEKKEKNKPKAGSVGVGGDVHKQNIHNIFRKEFAAKGVPDEHITGALALMEARAKSWASEEKGRNPDDWYGRIADVKSVRYNDSPEYIKSMWDKLKNGEISINSFTEEMSANGYNTHYGNSDMPEYLVKSTSQAAVEMLEDGRVVIHAYRSPDFATLVHEIGHVFEVDLTESEKKAVKKYGGSEAFARGFEKYIYDGKAPTAELKTLFDKFKNWLTDIYRIVKESGYFTPTEEKITPEIKKIFDRLLTEQKSVEQSLKEQPAAEKKEKPKIKPKEKSGKLSVGEQITYGGSTWTVTSIGKKRVSVTNGSVKTSYDRAIVESMISGDDGATKPTLKPKKRFSEKDISDVVDHYGVSESAAVEILDAISGTKDKNTLAKKIEQIISGDQQTSIKAPLKGGESMTDAELASVTPSQNIIQATTDFEGKPHTALANSSAVPFNQAQADLKNDGRIQFDSGVEDIGGLDNQSLFDIMTGDNTGTQRGIAAAYIAAHRMISDKNSPLVALFSKVGKKIRIINSSVFNVYDQKGKFVKKFDSRQEAEAFKQENPGFRVDYPPIMAAQEDGTLVLNAHMLNERLEEFWGEKRFLNWMEMALYEEAIHLTQMQTATELEMNQIFGEMSSEEKELVADKYGVRVADLSKFQMASEYVRMIVQNNLFGTTTEMLKPKRAARNYLSKILDRLIEYFGGKKDRITDQVVARIEETVRGARNESLPKIKSVEKLVSEKPRISILEDGVDGPIYKVQYKNYQFAVGQGMSRAGQVFYEVEKIKGEWVPKELLGSNPSEALVALKYRVDQNRGLGTSIGELGAASLDDWFFTGDLGVRQRNLQVARKMREAGIGEIAVKLATGWELGGDGKWRYEIADDQIDFSYQKFKESKPGKEFKLYEILNHPELYKAYPFIKDVRVISESGSLFDGVQGYVSVAGEIGLSLNAVNPESTLLHEIQHLIQRVEGFAKGGNSSTHYQMMSDSQIFGLAADNAIALLEENDRLISKIQEYEDFQDAINSMSSRDRQWAQDVMMSLDNIIHLSKKRQSIYERINSDKSQFKNKPAGWSVNDHPDMVKINEQVRVNSLDLVGLLNQSAKELSLKTEFNDSIVNEMWASRLYEKASLKDIFSSSKAYALSEYDANKERANMYRTALTSKDRDLASRLVADDNADSYKMYKRLAGEVEARNTQARQSMSAEERRESLLADTEDVSEEDKVYLMTEIGNTQVEKNELRTSQSDSFEDEFLNKKYEEFHGKEEAPTGADPIGDYVIEFGKDVVSQVGYTHLSRMSNEADKRDTVDLSDYEVPVMKLAQAEWDIGEIVFRVFTDYEFGSALDYFIDKLNDESLALPIRMILARKMIEKFEGRPDIARFIRVKIDLKLGRKAGQGLISRRDWGTKNTGNPRDNKTSPAAPASGVSTRGLWGRDISEEQENIITATVPGAMAIIEAKSKLDDALGNDVDAEVEETLGMMLDQSEERVAELEAEIKELRLSAKSESVLIEVRDQIGVAQASANKLSKEFSAAKSDAALGRLQKRWNKKNPVKELKDLINKIAKSCSA